MAAVLAGPLQPNAASAAGETTARAATTASVRVASYNVRSVQNDKKASGNELPWRKRRVRVIADIIKQRLDVVGIQEASQSKQYQSNLVDGINQYLDLRNGLNKAGGTYELTNTVMYNCVRPDSNTNCQYQYRGASRSTRILYNSSTLSMVSSGSYEYRAQSDGPNDTRYLVWAVFQVKATGARFLFANTHLANRYADLQRAQWEELVAKVNSLKGDLPVVVVGDFQRSKTKQPAADMMQQMKAAGYGDVVGQKPMTYLVDKPRPNRLAKAWINSVNGFDRNVADFSFENDRKKLANNCDWIFASNYLPVQKWKVVVHMNPDTLRLRGIIPSDHNLVWAKLVLS